MAALEGGYSINRLQRLVTVRRSLLASIVRSTSELTPYAVSSDGRLIGNDWVSLWRKGGFASGGGGSATVYVDWRPRVLTDRRVTCRRCISCIGSWRGGRGLGWVYAGIIKLWRVVSIGVFDLP